MCGRDGPERAISNVRAVRVVVSLPVARSHTRTVVSSPPLTAWAPMGSAATVRTRPVCPTGAGRIPGVSRSHSRRVPPSPPVTRCSLPFTSSVAMLRTAEVCPVRMLVTSPEETSQTRIVPSDNPAAASIRPCFVGVARAGVLPAAPGRSRTRRPVNGSQTAAEPSAEPTMASDRSSLVNAATARTALLPLRPTIRMAPVSRSRTVSTPSRVHANTYTRPWSRRRVRAPSRYAFHGSCRAAMPVTKGWTRTVPSAPTETMWPVLPHGATTMWVTSLS